MPWNGYGKTLTLSTAQQVVFPDAAGICSIYNSGAAAIYVAANCSLTEFAAIVTAATYITIPAGQTYSFTSINARSLSNICAQSASGTNTVYVNAY